MGTQNWYMFLDGGAKKFRTFITLLVHQTFYCKVEVFFKAIWLLKFLLTQGELTEGHSLSNVEQQRYTNVSNDIDSRYTPRRALWLKGKNFLEVPGPKGGCLSSIRVKAFSALTPHGGTLCQTTSASSGNCYFFAGHARQRCSPRHLSEDNDGETKSGNLLFSFLLSWPLPFCCVF